MVLLAPSESNVDASHRVAALRPRSNKWSKNSGSMLNLLTAPKCVSDAGSAIG